MGNPFTEAVGNVLTEIVGKVLDIYIFLQTLLRIPRSWLPDSFLPSLSGNDTLAIYLPLLSVNYAHNRALPGSPAPLVVLIIIPSVHSFVLFASSTLICSI